MHKGTRTVYLNGKIFTSDPDNLYAQAMMVQNGRITWVGLQSELPPGPYDAVIDLQGCRVLPGFLDIHMHPVMLADFSQKISCLPPRVCSLNDLKEAIREVRRRQGSDTWIEGWGYDEGKLAEGRAPTRYDLDAGCSDAPVSIIRTCGHIRCVNSTALAMAGITKDTPDPQGGRIERDETGEPTGILWENARNLVAPLIPETTQEQKVDLLLQLGQLLLSQGITAICDMGNLDPSDNYDIYVRAVERGFPQRVGLYHMWDYFADRPDFQIPSDRFDRSNQIFVAGLKLIGDGSVSGRTAWMHTPYLGNAAEYGLPVCSDPLLESAISFCKQHHCQLSMHAMGGRAIDRIVNRIYPETPWTFGNVPHLRMEHWTEPSPQAIQKSAEKGLAVATQPIFLYAEVESYLANLGPERMKGTYPIQTMRKAGVPLCFSSDAPATSWALPSDPFPALKSAVTRTAWDGTDCGIQQAVNLETAIQLYTRESAHIAGFSDMGILKAGFRANFIILNQDIFSMDPLDIDRACVTATYINGKQVYERTATP